jgi:Na+/proline symporter
MTVLRKLLINLGFLTGFLLVFGMDAWPSRWLAALIVSFFAVVGGVWAIAYATHNEAPK